MTNIYALIDPRTSECRYVGKANNPDKRLVSHLSPSKLSVQTHKTCWLVGLLAAGGRPEMVILEKVPKAAWAEAEMYWIAILKSLGADLTNDNAGGIQFKMSDQAKSKLSATAKNRVGHLASMYGKHRSAETRAKISAGHKGKKKSPEHLEKICRGSALARLRPEVIEKERVYHSTPPSDAT